jgi:hypothetical protein
MLPILVEVAGSMASGSVHSGLASSNTVEMLAMESTGEDDIGGGV